jgi:hypothetical protein
VAGVAFLATVTVTVFSWSFGASTMIAFDTLVVFVADVADVFDFTSALEFFLSAFVSAEVGRLK